MVVLVEGGSNDNPALIQNLGDGGCPGRWPRHVRGGVSAGALALRNDSLLHTTVVTARGGDCHSFTLISRRGGMATIERPREASQLLNPQLTTAIPTPFPRELLQSAHTQREDIVRPATAPASPVTTNSTSTAEQCVQNAQHEPTRENMVSDRLSRLFDFLKAYVR